MLTLMESSTRVCDLHWRRTIIRSMFWDSIAISSSLETQISIAASSAERATSYPGKLLWACNIYVRISITYRDVRFRNPQQGSICLGRGLFVQFIREGHNLPPISWVHARRNPLRKHRLEYNVVGPYKLQFWLVFAYYIYHITIFINYAGTLTKWRGARSSYISKTSRRTKECVILMWHSTTKSPSFAKKLPTTKSPAG